MNDQELISDIRSALNDLEGDVALRNTYISERDRNIYEDGLMEGLEFPAGHDKTLYNYLLRAVEIHNSQFLGRGFAVFSQFDKEDVSLFDVSDEEQKKEGELVSLKNKARQSQAFGRKKIVDTIIRDNGGMSIFKEAGEIASAYGHVCFKAWYDKKEGRYRIVPIESIENTYVFWSDDNFRDFDAFAYVYQISPTAAMKDYGSKLKEGHTFDESDEGRPLHDGNTADPIDQKSSTGLPPQTLRKMVTVVDFTGVLAGWGVKGKEVVKVKRGEEKPFSVLIVGGCIVQTITSQDLLPKYYLIPNKRIPRRAWGVSDVSDSAIQVNRTIVEVMSNWTTLFHKEVFPTYKAVGFIGGNLPKRQRKQTTFIPMQPEQDINLLDQPNNFAQQSNQLIEELKESLVRLLGVGRVLFDDPTINPSSNQALITTLKPVIDAAEDKQALWSPILVDMFTDALNTVAKFDKNVKELVDTDEEWYFYVQFPSILRREDASFQQMVLNRFNAGNISLESYLEMVGVQDVQEEIDRIRDNMKDPYVAAVLGRALPQLAQLALEKLNPPAAPQPDVKVSLRGDLTPYQEANLATQQGFNDGPFPPTAGPQGNQGLIAQENADNAEFMTDDAFAGGTPIQRGPQGEVVGGGAYEDAPQPTLTTDQNTGQTASQPGSGATAVSPEGAIAQNNQRRGR